MSKVEQLGKICDNYGECVSDGEDFMFSHGLGDIAKHIVIDRRIGAGDATSWTQALLNLRAKLERYIDRIDKLLEKR